MKNWQRSIFTITKEKGMLNLKYFFDDLITPYKSKLKRNKKPKFDGANPSGDQRGYAKRILDKNGLNGEGERLINITAYFVKYQKSFCTWIHSSKTDVLEERHERLSVIEMSKILATAPWLGDSDNAYIHAIEELLEKKIIYYYQMWKDGHNCVVFELNIDEICLDAEIKAKIKRDWAEAEQKRNDYKFGEERSRIDKMLDVIKSIDDHDKYITLNIATFHARTIMNVAEDAEELKRLLKEYPHLVVNIMVIGKRSSRTAKEHAGRRKFKKAYLQGIANTYKDFAEYKNRVNIRAVCSNNEVAYLRGSLILADNEIKYCSQLFWGFGNERGVYSKEIVTKSDNAMSRNFHYLFERYFRESYPEHKICHKVIYNLKQYGGPLFVSALISLFLVLVFKCITAKTGFQFGDNFYSTAAALVMFWGTKFYHCIRRKFFIM